MRYILAFIVHVTLGFDSEVHRVHVWNDANTLHLARQNESVLVSNVPVFSQLASIKESAIDFVFPAQSQHKFLPLPLRNVTHVDELSGSGPLLAVDDDLLAITSLAEDSKMQSVFVYRLLNRSWSALQVLTPPSNQSIIGLATARNSNFATIAITTLDQGRSEVYIYSTNIRRPFEFSQVYHDEFTSEFRLPAVAVAHSATRFVFKFDGNCTQLAVLEWQPEDSNFSIVHATTVISPAADEACSFGASVAMVGERGQAVIVGAPRIRDDTMGFIAIYDQMIPGGKYLLTQQLRPKTDLDYRWGAYIAAQDDILLVAAQPGSTGRRPSVVVYQRCAGFYRQVQELHPRTMAMSFGNSLAVYGNTIAVGSSQADGGVYLYQLQDDNNRVVCVDTLSNTTSLPHEPAASTYSVALSYHGLIVVAIREQSSDVYSLSAGTKS